MTIAIRILHRFFNAARLSRIWLLGLMFIPTLAIASNYEFPFPDIPASFPPLPAGAIGPTIPQNPGWIVQQVRPDVDNVYWVTDGTYQAMFIVTRDGVILCDAPDRTQAFPALPVLTAIKQVTNLPVTHMIYSHAHLDHIGGAGLVKAAFPNVKIIGQDLTYKILKGQNNPATPLPTETFDRRAVLDVGGERIELYYFGNTHLEGNTFIYLPREKVLMVVDVVYPGWVPFWRLAGSSNPAGWVSAFDRILGFDFKTIVTGHLNRIGTRDDVVTTKEYVDDIKRLVYASMNDTSGVAKAAAAIGAEQGDPTFAFTHAESHWAVSSAFLDFWNQDCVEPLDAKWFGVLAGAETYDAPNCSAWYDAVRAGIDKMSPFFPDTSHADDDQSDDNDRMTQLN